MTAVRELQRENAAAKQDTDALKIRLTLLETVVNRLLGGEASGQSMSSPESFTDGQVELQRLKMEKDEWESQRGSLEMAYSDLLKEKSSLEEEKERLSERLEKVQQRQCPPVAETSRSRDQPIPPRQGES